MSVPSTDNTENPSKEKQTRGTLDKLFIVQFLKHNTILLSRSQLPEIKEQKKQALEKLKSAYEQKYGKRLQVTQLSKKLINLKARLRDKCEANKAADTKIPLKAWEKEFQEILDRCIVTQDPAQTRKRRNFTSDITQQYETFETERLSLRQLQRLVLLKHNQVLSKKLISSSDDVIMDLEEFLNLKAG